MPGQIALLFIGHLAPDCRVRDLESIFSKYGRLTRCDIKRGGYGFVEYEDPRDAEDALRGCDGMRLLGERMVVEWARGPRNQPSSSGYNATSINHNRDKMVDGKEGNECFRCGGRGHYARQCPSSTGGGMGGRRHEEQGRNDRNDRKDRKDRNDRNDRYDRHDRSNNSMKSRYELDRDRDQERDRDYRRHENRDYKDEREYYQSGHSRRDYDRRRERSPSRGQDSSPSPVRKVDLKPSTMMPSPEYHREGQLQQAPNPPHSPVAQHPPSQ